MWNYSVMTVQIWPVQTSHFVYCTVSFVITLPIWLLSELLRGVAEMSILPYKNQSSLTSGLPSAPFPRGQEPTRIGKVLTTHLPVFTSRRCLPSHGGRGVWFDSLGPLGGTGSQSMPFLLPVSNRIDIVECAQYYNMGTRRVKSARTSADNPGPLPARQRSVCSLQSITE